MSKDYGRPIKGRVLVKPIPKNHNKDNSPLFIPEESFTTPNSGTIISVGQDVDLTDGDIVLYGKEAGTPIELDGADFILLWSDDILLIKSKQ